jgi:hypothetical protein
MPRPLWGRHCLLVLLLSQDPARKPGRKRKPADAPATDEREIAAGRGSKVAGAKRNKQEQQLVQGAVNAVLSLPQQQRTAAGGGPKRTAKASEKAQSTAQQQLSKQMQGMFGNLQALGIDVSDPGAVASIIASAFAGGSK